MSEFDIEDLAREPWVGLKGTATLALVLTFRRNDCSGRAKLQTDIRSRDFCYFADAADLFVSRPDVNNELSIFCQRHQLS